MTQKEYNLLMEEQRGQLWADVFRQNYKPGKKRAEQIAAVHADNALRMHRQRFPLEVTILEGSHPHVPRHNHAAAAH